MAQDAGWTDSGTQAGLSGPNGLWVRPDGGVAILDLDNEVRADPMASYKRCSPCRWDYRWTRPVGHDDESLVFFSSATTVKWTASKA
jgi:hypothetical protein